MQAIGALEGAGHRVALGGPQARQPQPQHGRRDADGDEDERRRRADRRVVGLREGRSAGARVRRSRRCGGSSGCRRPRRLARVRRTRRRAPAARRRVRSKVAVARAGCAGSARGGRGATAGLETLTPDRRAEFERRLAEIDRKWPAAGRATVKDFVDHIDYAVKLIGIDHVGISSDFDGGGGIDGWNSAAETFNVTLELVRRGYTEEQIAKIWSGNLLRVWGEVEKVAKTDSGERVMTGTARTLTLMALLIVIGWPAACRRARRPVRGRAEAGRRGRQELRRRRALRAARRHRLHRGRSRAIR